MRGFFDRTKQAITNSVQQHLWDPQHEQRLDTAPIPPSLKGHNRITNAPDKLGVDPSTRLDILRYRYHHGTNLGSVFVLERWLSPSMFPDDCPGDQTSELAAVTSWVNSIGIHATREKF